MIRLLIAVLQALIPAPRNWRCGQCDTYNAPSDPVCIVCGLR